MLLLPPRPHCRYRMVVGLLSGLIVVLPAISATAQTTAVDNPAPPGPEPAERLVTVIKPSTDLKTGSKVVGQAMFGETYRVTQTNGNWLWLPDRKGWVSNSDVVPAEQAVATLSEWISRDPSSEHYHMRAILHLQAGDFAKAAEDLSGAIRRDPGALELINARGNARRMSGDLTGALADFNQLIDKRLQDAALYTNRGLTRMDLGQIDEALEDFAAAIKIDARFAPAWEAAGTARQLQKIWRKAVQNYGQAVILDPQFDRAWNNLAWLLATCPEAAIRDGKRAVDAARKACELTEYQDAGYLDTLAASLAETGTWDEAIARAEAALPLAPPDARAGIAARLKLYQSRQPYRMGLQPAPADTEGPSLVPPAP